METFDQFVNRVTSDKERSLESMCHVFSIDYDSLDENQLEVMWNCYKLGLTEFGIHNNYRQNLNDKLNNYANNREEIFKFIGDMSQQVKTNEELNILENISTIMHKISN